MARPRVGRAPASIVLVACLAFAGLTAVGSPASATAMLADRASAAGIAEPNESWSARPLDYNNDGRQDLCIDYHDQGVKLWRNTGNGYVAAAEWPSVNDEGKIPDRHDCVTADFDHNGLADLYITAGRSGANLVKNGQGNQLLLQKSAGTFTDVGTQWGVDDVCGRSHHAIAVDVNNDGWQDIFVGDAVPRDDPSDPCDDPANKLPSETSKLYINQHGTGFVERSAAYGTNTNMGVRCAQSLDYDHDGWKDLLVCTAAAVLLFHNEQGMRFTSHAVQPLQEPVEQTDATAGDLNGDGWPDIVWTTSSQVAYRLNTHGTFGPSTTVAGITHGRAVAVGDIDGDGDGDIYSLRSDIAGRTNFDDAVYRNNHLSFSKMHVPSAGGLGDDVVAIDRNGDGRQEFLVLNGAEDGIGPPQLIVLTG